LCRDIVREKFLNIYPGSHDELSDLFKLMEKFRNERNIKLKKRDEFGSQWIKSEKTVGIMLYVDLFSENLEGLIKHSDHFVDLGITLIHLMPLLMPREGENDGGYAVKNYREIDRRIGDMATFKEVISHYHNLGIRICIDYVINHTSDDHLWAQKALAGDKNYQNYYIMYDEEFIPLEFEKTLEDVFPKIAPGNFTYKEEIRKWVMTTFYPFQWDLNYKNPKVFNEMIENLLFFSNLGVDMVRLDAIPYIWKEVGTKSRNLHKVHLILNLFRDVLAVVAPSTAILGEAIVAPEIILTYFGSEELPECHCLYNASYMVEIWNSIATRDGRHISRMNNTKTLEEAVWINYARCHDDIGWGLDNYNLEDMGFEPYSHKDFLIKFYSGEFNESFAVGELYEFNKLTGDARNSGTLASLAGLERAIFNNDRYQWELALKRIELINGLFIFRKGIPMIYSGDEVGQLNDYSYKLDKTKSHDSRWVHRGKFNWEAKSPVFEIVKKIIDLRKSVYKDNPIMKEEVVNISNNNILCIKQTLSKNSDEIFMIFNFSEDRKWVYNNELGNHGIKGVWRDTLYGKKISFDEETTLLGPYEFFVLKKACNCETGFL